MDPISSRRRRRALVTATLLLAAPLFAAAQEPAAEPAPVTLAADTVWKGQLLIESPVVVPPGVTLTVREGATVRFRAAASLSVHGVLRAEGAPGQPITFAPEGDGPWAGLTLGAAATPSVLRECRILAAGKLLISAGEHLVERCEITGGATGIEVNGDGAAPRLKGNRIHDVQAGGVTCVGKSVPLLEGNTLERCGPFGVHASQGAAPVVQGNTIAGCGSGIELIQTAPLVRDNRIAQCERGIALSSASGGKPLTGNTIEGCGAGIFVQMTSSPEIAGNTIAGNKEGVVCIMGAQPLIRNNAIRDNGTGISCTQLSPATIEANAIERNQRGVFLTLSSYAVLHGNNFEGNEVHLELGNMSRDWERRAGNKPRRGLQQQRAVRAERGVGADAAGGGDGFDVAGDAVDATGNWWGEATTREMAQKGPDADIAGLRDWHDVPTLTYEGWEGAYVQDRIAYAPWAAARIAGAGLSTPAPEGPRPAAP
jgi:parallel beta-helix repeat protein